jgi:hypothetical protein
LLAWLAAFSPVCLSAHPLVRGDNEERVLNEAISSVRFFKLILEDHPELPAPLRAALLDVVHTARTCSCFRSRT